MSSDLFMKLAIAKSKVTGEASGIKTKVAPKIGRDDIRRKLSAKKRK